MGHGLETWDIVHSLTISSRDLASTIKSKSAAIFTVSGFLILLAALPAEFSLIAFGGGSLLLF